MKKTKKVAVLGHFGDSYTCLDGQTVKTKALSAGLKAYSDFDVIEVDTHGWKKKPFALYQKILSVFKNCDAVIMLPAQNGVKLFAPLLLHLKRKYQKKIFYDVIGGWLPKMLESKQRLSKTLKEFDGVWVETNVMKKVLDDQGFTNVAVVPNFKELKILDEKELVYPKEKPYKLCTFSRVMKEKGIEDAVNAVKSLNEMMGETVASLDIYGQVDSGQGEWFDALMQSCPGYVQYRGCVDANQSVETLKDYFVLLFPTRFYTEGIPGTIIDAYAAGVPVVAAKWESFADVIEEGQTGIGYEFQNEAALLRALQYIFQNEMEVFRMKKNCIKQAEHFVPQNVIADLINYINV